MPLDPDDIVDTRTWQRLSTLMLAVTDDDFDRHDPPPGLAESLANQIADDSRQAITVVDRPQVVTNLDTRRRGRSGAKRAGFLLAAAAVLVAVVIGSAILALGRPQAERVVATTNLRQLEPLGTTSASARLVTKNSTTRLVVDARNMPPAPPGETYELWLIDTTVSDPRSLGVMAGSEEVTVPPSIDPRTHPIVDISLEPVDGDHHHHSGHSLMRGTLT